MFLLYRILPLLSSLIIAGAFYFQFNQPFDYPWFVVLGIIVLVTSAYSMSRKRVDLWDMVEKMLPTMLLILALAFAMLLTEGQFEQFIIIGLSFVCSFLSLQLLFFLCFMPSRYPVGGLSKVNIAYVPLIILFSVSTSTGMITFLHTPRWPHMVGIIILGILLFRTTGHPEASVKQNRTWMLVGAIAGLYLGLLGAMLPLGLWQQGALSMIIFCGILRMRRYLYNPLPSKRQAVSEFVLAVVFLLAIAITSRWL